MKNHFNGTNSSLKIFSLFIIYYPLILIILGTILNLLTFIILCRTTFKNARKRPTIHYMRTIAIFDILILYGWNLDQYLERTIGIKMTNYSVISCKIFTFLNYFIYHVSAWLRVFICFDRYLSLSRLHRTWFSISKNVLILISFLMLIFILINLHIFPFVCYYENDQVNIESRYYTIYPMWDRVNLIIYNCLPFSFMIIFNSGIIYHLILLRRISTVRKTSRIQHRSISITLLLTTCLFFLMTTPVSIAYAYFSHRYEHILYALDSILYTYHILGFPVYFLTFREFRREFFKLITLYNCRKCKNLSTIHHDTTIKNVVNHLFIISDTSLK
ncbi:unnamed protein product [Adineta steineri]|uniref:G-protein coupled receptors family 1 profile domain-containing protein n=1 Tax=Adineta steineri TaxID=433720 RepID=A0A814XSI7_9BILA|nr:unnamed protein product [Adineta steineri]CAF1219771.1 unnamed protein product [Adineta steineri]